MKMDYLVYNYRENDGGLVVVTFKMNTELLQLLDRYAINHGLNRSEAIRKAIVEMIESESGEVGKARVVSGGRL